MLCQLKEGGKKKADLYWPLEAKKTVSLCGNEFGGMIDSLHFSAESRRPPDPEPRGHRHRGEQNARYITGCQR